MINSKKLQEETLQQGSNEELAALYEALLRKPLYYKYYLRREHENVHIEEPKWVSLDNIKCIKPVDSTCESNKQTFSICYHGEKDNSVFVNRQAAEDIFEILSRHYQLVNDISDRMTLNKYNLIYEQKDETGK